MFSNLNNETTFFAFSLPFSYEENQQQIDDIETLFKTANPVHNLYFHRETVYYSAEGRKMEMMTISSNDGITDQREAVPSQNNDYKGIFPEAASKGRPFLFEDSKKVCVFTSRVHTGESPGSFMLNGLIELMCDLKSE